MGAAHAMSARGEYIPPIPVRSIVYYTPPASVTMELRIARSQEPTERGATLASGSTHSEPYPRTVRELDDRLGTRVVVPSLQRASADTDGPQ